MSTVRSYIVGFVLSVGFTLAAFGLVWQYAGNRNLFMPENLIVILIGLAMAQLYVQLVYFLHLGWEEKPRWHLITFTFAAFIVLVLVGGTIWIMYHLQSGHDLSEIYPTGEVSPQNQDD